MYLPIVVVVIVVVIPSENNNYYNISKTLKRIHLMLLLEKVMLFTFEQTFQNFN